jgi:hypothetical protein
MDDAVEKKRAENLKKLEGSDDSSNDDDDITDTDS